MKKNCTTKTEISSKKVYFVIVIRLHVTVEPDENGKNIRMYLTTERCRVDDESIIIVQDI